jgi:hypothetical protein
LYFEGVYERTRNSTLQTPKLLRYRGYAIYWGQAWNAEFLLEIDLKNLLGKTGARLIFKIALMSLHIDPGNLEGYAIYWGQVNRKNNNINVYFSYSYNFFYQYHV